MIPVGFGGASGSYSITNSARFNGTSDYLSKTLTTSATTSGSVWVKRSKLGATLPIFDNKVYFTSGDALYAFGLTSTALYRDPSAWYHIFWNGTGVYVNGTLVTGSGTYTAASVANPRLGYDGSNYFSGYLSDFAFWNGSSASLQGGGTDANGVWVAKRPAAGYSFLAFGSSGALGTDTSGNGNTWTVNSSPVQTTDTPTNNSCTWNFLDKSSLTLANGNLTASYASTTHYGGRGSIALPTTGKWYFEANMDSAPSATVAMSLGIATPASVMGPGVAGTWFLIMSSSTYIYRETVNGTVTGMAAPGQNQTLQVAYDAGNNRVWLGKNNVWADASNGVTGNPSAGTNPTVSSLPSGVMPYVGCYQSALTANFGATAFAYTPPTGFLPLNSTNAPSVAVATSGTFTGNANADGPFVWTNGNPATLTINGNAVTFGTHADKTAGGFKLRSSSASYNTSGSNTWTATAGKRFVYSATSINTAQGNP